MSDNLDQEQEKYAPVWSWRGMEGQTAMLMLLLGEHLGEGEHNVTGLEGPRQSHVGRAPCS